MFTVERELRDELPYHILYIINNNLISNFLFNKVKIYHYKIDNFNMSHFLKVFNLE